jgi:antitoxin ParD1/3/4
MPNQVSKNVSLTTELDAFITAEVASGRYQNASEVVRAALRIMADHELRLVPRRKPAKPVPSPSTLSGR